MRSTPISVIGLGSSGSLFLRDLPADRDLFGIRVAADSDPAVLKSLSTIEVDHRLHLRVSKSYRKDMPTQANQELMRIAADLEGPLRTSLCGSSVYLIAAALGGLTSSALLNAWLPVLSESGARIVLLALWPGIGSDNPSTKLRADASLCQAARHCTSLCLINMTLLASGQPEDRTVRQLFALSSALRVGHALDWERLARSWDSRVAQ